MEISSFPGSFGDNSTPKDMTYTHIVGKQIFFDFFEHFLKYGNGWVPISKISRKECIFERFSTWTKKSENMSF